MQVRSLAKAFSFVLIAATITACSSTDKDSVKLVAAPSSPIADVPIPAGFWMVNSESTSKIVAASGLRFVDHNYKGSDNYLPTVSFFREQLPTKSWLFADQSQTHDAIALHFTKGNENCVVTITEGVRHTHVRVQIDPILHGTSK